MAKKPPAIYLNSDNYHLFKELPNESAGELIKAIFAYAVDDKIVELSSANSIKGMFNLIKAQIDRNNAHYAEVSKKRSEAGKKGGAPKGNKNAKKSSVYSTDNASFDVSKYSNSSIFDD